MASEQAVKKAEEILKSLKGSWMTDWDMVATALDAEFKRGYEDGIDPRKPIPDQLKRGK